MYRLTNRLTGEVRVRNFLTLWKNRVAQIIHIKGKSKIIILLKLYAFSKSPFETAKNALVKPQLGHSNPNILYIRQIVFPSIKVERINIKNRGVKIKQIIFNVLLCI